MTSKTRILSQVLGSDNLIPASALSANLAYTGTFTGSTGILNIGSGQIYKDASGNVGIGNTTPSTYGAKLTVASLTGTQASIMVTNPGQGSGHLGIAAAGSNVKLYNTYTSGTLATGKGIDITAGGYVGFNNLTPAHPVCIGTAPVAEQLVGIRVYTGEPSSWKGAGAFGYSAATVIMGELGSVATLGGHNGSISAWANLAINPGGGLVGIGTNAPTHMLTVNGPIKAGGNTDTVAITMTNATYGAVLELGGWTQTTGVSKIRASNGNLHIDCQGTGYGIYMNWYASTTTNFGGAVVANGSVTQNASDARLKTNIVEIPNALDKLALIRGVYYDWDLVTCENVGFHPEHEHDVGVIAQEMQIVLPECVKPAPFNKNPLGGLVSDENYLTVQYEKIVPLLIQSIKEQQIMIANLNVLNETMLTRLAALEVK